MSELSFYKRKRQVNYGLLKEILVWIFEIVMVIVFAFMFVYLFGSKTSVIGESMSPTIESEQIILINKLSYIIGTPDRGDIVVFKPNGNQKAHYYVKRVIGIPGDTILIKNGKIYVNGEELDDDFGDQIIENAGIASEEVRVGDDEYFVLGDNRNNGEDSRYANVGNVNKEYIAGKAWFRISPISKIGLVN